ncbi:hypothetical protein GMW39_15445 [Pectobacterium parmentieri]|uniref:phage filamentation protein Fil family protein n=1 Tax=Pectobacterium TaxID=122277 RepID=UPI0013741FCF|nr:MULTISPECIES: phage filamentation protein Fil family protein [Pectobacterium]MCA6926730.1 DUF2724 domain-containing protein [Pectobacterium versatile]MCH5083477.1 DUF2724 domain-containing protein [Pectobacterium versatile]QHQ17105.1 hypothetical protein GMW39_15445 [Pectobacterium parmentieri]
MISIARLLISQSPAPVIQGGGWLELPDGRRCQPTPRQVYFAPWSQKPYVPARKKCSVRLRILSVWQRLTGAKGTA